MGSRCRGMATRADAIPATLGLLNKLPAFQGQHFATFEAGRVALASADPGRSVEVLSFRLDSVTAKEGTR